MQGDKVTTAKVKYPGSFANRVPSWLAWGVSFAVVGGLALVSVAVTEMVVLAVGGIVIFFFGVSLLMDKGTLWGTKIFWLCMMVGYASAVAGFFGLFGGPTRVI